MVFRLFYKHLVNYKKRNERRKEEKKERKLIIIYSVRFHAWQSALLFTAVFVLHLIFSWSTFISWLMFVGDVAGIGYLSFRAYRDAETLDRCEVPFFGRLASSILDDE